MRPARRPTSPRPFVLVLLLAGGALLAGCASPGDAPTPPTKASGPIDLTGQRGLLLLDIDHGTASVLSSEQALAWVSPGATYVTWTQQTFAVVRNFASGERDVGTAVAWTRVHDNGSALELDEKQAHLRGLVNGTAFWSVTLPDAPPNAMKWGAASDDLEVLGAEIPRSRPLACVNEIILRTRTLERYTGCHLRIAGDGRVGWTEGNGVRTRAPDGTVTNVTGPGQGSVQNGTFVAHENPVFTRSGLLMLRLTGGETLTQTEVLAADGSVLARMSGERRLAILDASSDGHVVLVTAFDR